MDFWVVVAAASAGCLAKCLQISSINKDGLSKLTYEGSFSGDEKNHLTHMFSGRKKLERDASKNIGNALNDEVFEMSRLNCGSSADWVSPSGLEHQASARELQEYNASSAESLPADFSKEQTETEDDYRIDIDSNNCNSSEIFSPLLLGGQIATFHGSSKHGHSLRCGHLQKQFLRPRSSLESCRLAQLYNRYDEMGDFSLNPLVPPISLNMRPLIVTDGSSIVSRSIDPSSRHAGAEVKKTRKKVYSESCRAVLGVPPLPTVKTRKKIQDKTGKCKTLGSSGKLTTGKKICSLSGTPAGTTLLCMGIYLGIIFSTVVNKKEVDKLKELLKQMENLVQDLQEELEMRDSLTVKELASENYESIVTHNNSIHGTAPSIFSPEQCIQSPANCNSKDTCIEGAGRTPDSMTRIEAELEEELERLGLNIKAANMEGRLSYAELDPDFVADFAEGEFRAEQDLPLNNANYRDSSCPTTRNSINYAGSAQELSLRLHEVIKSRLEERIEELELALQNSQRKVQLLESSASKNQSCPPIEDLQPLDPHQSSREPLVMSLSGEALSAYHEGYGELVKFEPEDGYSPSGLYESTHQEIDNVCATGYDESSGTDDEKEKLMIKQIIERTKKGSPVILNALLSIDEI